MTDKEFWSTTPKIIFNRTKILSKYRASKEEAPAGFIDEVL